METQGIQLWTVPVTGSYTIRAAGQLVILEYKGRDIQTITTLTKGEVIKILVGQQGIRMYISGWERDPASGGGGTFVVRDTQNAIIIAGGGGNGGNGSSNYSGGGGSYAINTMTINGYNSSGQGSVTITQN